MKKLTPQIVMRALIYQVMKARPTCESEQAVRTYISRPMWIEFLVATGMTRRQARKTNPTEWKIGCHRVYGSETIVIESEDMFSWSVRLPKP